MMNKTVLKLYSIMFFGVITLSNCNSKKNAYHSFEVIVETDSKTDSIFMYPSYIRQSFLDSTYTYLFKGSLQDAKVRFNGNKPAHPVMFDFLSISKGLSEKFFVENGTTLLFVTFENDTKNVVIEPKMKSDAQKEYEELKKNGLDSIELQYDKAETAIEAERFANARDSLMVDFLKKNPDSYVPLWLMVNSFSRSALKYNQRYDESLRMFSNEVRDSDLFKKFEFALKESKNFVFGAKEIELKNINLDKINFNKNTFSSNKFILLDFWFSNCGPCLREMPKYIPLYQKYKNKGFEIISISTDNTKYIDKWKNIIKDRNFNWTHYLDENGIEADRIGINSYPTTFLIDNQGNMIERDLTTVRLAEFLKSNLD